MKILPSDSAERMSAAVEAPAPEGQLHCKLCGLVYSGEAGRLQYNLFVCTPCGNVDRNIRRNLGDRNGLPTWSCEDQQHFFRQIRESRKGQRVDWKTIKAAFVTSLTTSVINSHTATVEAEELPLSVWLQRGWEESLVKAQATVYSEEYKAWVYRVPVKRLTWIRTFSEVEEKVLAKEQEATKQRGAKRGDVELDLPLDKTGKASEKEGQKSEKTEAAAAKKLVAGNAKIHAASAKAMGPLSSAEASLDKALNKAQAMSVDLEEGTLKCANATLLSLRDYGAACRHAVNQQQRNKTKAEGEVPEVLEALPFDAVCLKALLKTQAEVCKQIKSELPQKEKKSKSQGTETKAGGPPAKRRRTKAAA